MPGSILYLEVNSSYAHSSLAGAMLRCWIEKMQPGWQWITVTATVKSNEQNIADDVITTAPDIIIATTYLFNRNFLLSVLSRCASVLPDTYIFLGGPEFNGDNTVFLQLNTYVQAVIRGDESSIHQLLAELKFIEKWKSIPGLCYFDSGVYVDNGSAEFLGDLDELPSVYSAGYIPAGKPFFQLETMRGCAGNCSFCSSAGKAIKYYSIERVKSDIELLRQRGIFEVRILDRTFNVSEARSIQLLEIFYNQFNNMKFHLEINPAILSGAMIEKFAEAPKNMLHLEVGVQSLNDDTLVAVKRFCKSALLLSNLQKLRHCRNLVIHADLIAGLPHQYYASILDDVSHLMQLEIDEIQLERLKILPGSAMDKKQDYKTLYNKEPPYQIYSTPTLSSENLKTVDHLSRMIDGWYNCLQLRNIIIVANKQISGFVEQFVDWLNLTGYFDHAGRGDLATRFLLLREYAKSCSQMLYDLVTFVQLVSGLPVNAIPLQHISALSLDEYYPVWQKTISTKYTARKYFLAKFHHNTAELWLNPDSIPLNVECKYIFEQYYGRNISAIYQQAALPKRT
jgi:radical SAM superfamily enzyme YgiQ (UPF0313 family)